MLKQGRSLLAKGITAVEGDFRAGEIVNVTNDKQVSLARGITQFSSSEIDLIRQKDISEIRSLFPTRKRHEVVHRSSMVMLEETE